MLLPLHLTLIIKQTTTFTFSTFKLYCINMIKKGCLYNCWSITSPEPHGDYSSLTDRCTSVLSSPNLHLEQIMIVYYNSIHSHPPLVPSTLKNLFITYLELFCGVVR